MVSTRKPDPTLILHLQGWAQICHLIDNPAVVAVRDCILTCTLLNGYDSSIPPSYLISTAMVSKRKPDPTLILHLQVWAQICHLIKNPAVVAVQEYILTCTLLNGYDSSIPPSYLISTAIRSTRKPDPTHILHLQVWAQICHLIENPAVVAVRDCILTCTLLNGYDSSIPPSYLISTAIRSTRKPDPTLILHLQVWAQICHLIDNPAVVAVRDCILTCTLLNGYNSSIPPSYLISTAMVSTRKPDPILILHLQVWAQICHLIENPAVVAVQEYILTCTLLNGYDSSIPPSYLISTAIISTKKADPTLILHFQVWAQICHLIENPAVFAVWECILTCTLLNGYDSSIAPSYFISTAIRSTRKPVPTFIRISAIPWRPSCS